MTGTSQITDDQGKTFFFSGSATLTTKGLSTFPNLTLGKPAANLELSMGGDKFRFEPIFRFALEGKPWTFIFWCRYEMLKTSHFQLKLGAHPAYSFKSLSISENGKTKEVLRAQQYAAGEISPVFFVTRSLSMGPYYIYARGLEKDIVRNSHFISFRINFSPVNLTNDFFLRWMAQAYYLKMDANDGYYLNTNLAFLRKNFPFSVSTTTNKTIRSEIPGGNFLWNINLTYAFGNKYSKS